MRQVAWQLIFSVGLISLLAFSFVRPIFAAPDETPLGIANYVPINQKSVPDASIISFADKGYFLSKIQYDTLMVGVVAMNPAVGLNIEDQPNSYPVIGTGTVYVRVSTVNGPIHKGDPITSSNIQGVGMKATRSGYILGIAEENYTVSNPKDIGKIQVVLNMHYNFINRTVSNSIFEIFNIAEVANYESPTVVFKYVVSAFIIILSFILGFVSFGRTAALGVEALGRNPLASKMIQVGILFNVIITVAIIFAGFAISYLVLRL